MPAWEYRAVGVAIFDIGDMLKDRNQRAMLDPEVSDREYMEQSFKEGRKDLTWLMVTPNRLHTTIKKALDMHGAEGWEMVGVSPTMKLWAGGQRADPYYSDFFLFFKRPVQE